MPRMKAAHSSAVNANVGPPGCCAVADESRSVVAESDLDAGAVLAEGATPEDAVHVHPPLGRAPVHRTGRMCGRPTIRVAESSLLYRGVRVPIGEETEVELTGLHPADEGDPSSVVYRSASSCTFFASRTAMLPSVEADTSTQLPCWQKLLRTKPVANSIFILPPYSMLDRNRRTKSLDSARLSQKLRSSCIISSCSMTLSGASRNCVVADGLDCDDVGIPTSTK